MNKNKQLESMLRLFKVYINEDIPGLVESTVGIYEPLSKGLLFVNNDKPVDVKYSIFSTALSIYGTDLEKLNNTFYKSFDTIQNLSDKEILLDQILHYITVYGFERLGKYDKHCVYIPKQLQDSTELPEDFECIILQEVSKETLTKLLNDFILTDIALSEQTLEDIMSLKEYIDISLIDKVKNKELRVKLYEVFNIVPSNNVEFLRYLLQKLTGNSMIIINGPTKYALIKSDRELAVELFDRYMEVSSLENLSKIFLRYKPLFMALKVRKPENKTQMRMNAIINKLGKLYKTTNKLGRKQNPLDYIYNLLSINPKFTLDETMRELNNISIYKEISIYNGLMTRYNSKKNNFVYKIRNGKAYIDKEKSIKTNFYYKNELLKDIADKILEHIVYRLTPTLKGKTIYIPPYVYYKCPTSEKNFVGNIPMGSFIILENTNLVLGIHWENVEDEQTDLDLFLQNDNECYSWNSQFRNEDRTVIHTGDMTDAPLPKGASEAVCLKNGIFKDYELSVKNYTYYRRKEVPYKFIISNMNADELKSNHIFKDIILSIDMKMDLSSANQTLAYIDVDKNNIMSVLFANNKINLGTYNIDNTLNNISREYYNVYRKSQLDLFRLLNLCGAKIVHNKEELYEMVCVDKEKQLYQKEYKQPDIDLSLETIDKTTFINLFK